MGFTKRKLVEFFDSLTALVSEENRKEADFQIQVFMDSFEKNYPYETVVRAENEVSYHRPLMWQQCRRPYNMRS